MKKESKKEVLLNVRIPVELKNMLDEYCRKNGLKQKFIVARAIEEYLKQQGV